MNTQGNMSISSIAIDGNYTVLLDEFKQNAEVITNDNIDEIANKIKCFIRPVKEGIRYDRVSTNGKLVDIRLGTFHKLNSGDKVCCDVETVKMYDMIYKNFDLYIGEHLEHNRIRFTINTGNIIAFNSNNIYTEENRGSIGSDNYCTRGFLYVK